MGSVERRRPRRLAGRSGHCRPEMVRTAKAAAIDSGAATKPRRTDRESDGRACAVPAALHHNAQASDPVTNRLGPIFSPISKAKGFGGAREANKEAAGRLFTNTLRTAATAAVAHVPRWDSRIRRPGPHAPQRAEGHRHSEEGNEDGEAKHLAGTAALPRPGTRLE